MIPILRLAAVALLLLIAPTALAWNAGGHMVSASIAYDVLKQDDPATLARVLDLLRQHPQFADHFAPKLDTVPADARERYLLMLAARWPDDVRRNKQYHHGSWHYVNLPYSPRIEIGTGPALSLPLPIRVKHDVVR